jgi:hypothetical protein
MYHVKKGKQKEKKRIGILFFKGWASSKCTPLVVDKLG